MRRQPALSQATLRFSPAVNCCNVFHYHFVEPNRSRENAATNAQTSSVQTEVQSSKSGIIKRSFSNFFLSEQ